MTNYDPRRKATVLSLPTQDYQGGNPLLLSVRVATRYEVTDAYALASKICGSTRTHPARDFETGRLAAPLLAGAILTTAYVAARRGRRGNLHDVDRLLSLTLDLGEDQTPETVCENLLKRTMLATDARLRPFFERLAARMDPQPGACAKLVEVARARLRDYRLQLGKHLEQRRSDVALERA